MAEFLLELFSEEIPARMQARAAADLQRLIGDALTAAGVPFEQAEAHVTPRRLALVVDGLPARQPDRREERKGPKVGAPDKAIDGFLKSTGLTLEQCQQRDTPKGPIWFAVFETPGRPTPEVLADILRTALPALPWPKSQRWAESGFRWVRPLHRVLALFDGTPLPGAWEPDPHQRFVFTALTAGHRFLAPGDVAVSGFADYRDRLRAAKVLLDREERKALIRREAERLATDQGLRLKDDPGLIDEVAGLVEWPVALLGRIDEDFMTVPAEVLTTAMRTHQRYFACETADGALAPRFVVIANTEPRDGGAAVVAGNEKVLRARLSDARFFWDQDRKQRLDDRLPALKSITFHAKLGTVFGRAERLRGLAEAIAGLISGHFPEPAPHLMEQAARAAHLAKADLVTGMVGEFPELQGLMGRYYAEQQGEPAAVAQAIGDHYAPLGPTDRCPTAPVAIAVALADKIDTLVGFWAIDEKPTGSRDPYALRRAALGAIRLAVENDLDLDLAEPCRSAIAAYQVQGLSVEEDALLADLGKFFADRLKVMLRDQGYRHDHIDAAFAAAGVWRPLDLRRRAMALQALLDSADGTNLLAGYRRAANIVRIEEKKDGRRHDGAVESSRLVAAAETDLHHALTVAKTDLSGKLAAEDYPGAMAVLAGLRPAIDAFFEGVTVNAEDAALRANRLALLTAIVATMNRVAEFAKVEG